LLVNGGWPKRSRWPRFNALRHGILSENIPFRDQAEAAEFTTHVTVLIRELRPSGSLELTLVEEIAVGAFKLRRLNSLEAMEFDARRQASTAIRQGIRTDPRSSRFLRPPDGRTIWLGLLGARGSRR